MIIKHIDKGSKTKGGFSVEGWKEKLSAPSTNNKLKFSILKERWNEWKEYSPFL